jgi:hypothetical protein
MTERVPKKQNNIFKIFGATTHLSLWIHGALSFLHSADARREGRSTWSNTQLGLVSVSRVSARRLNNVYSRAKGVVWGPLGRASPLVSALVTFSHALISPSPDADLNADLLASERACSVS